MVYICFLYTAFICFKLLLINKPQCLKQTTFPVPTTKVYLLCKSLPGVYVVKYYCEPNIHMPCLFDHYNINYKIASEQEKANL